MRVRTRTYWYILVHTVLCLFFRLENTCSVQVTIGVVPQYPLPSPWAAPTQQMLMAGVAALCMRSTLGSGCLRAASPAWGGLSVEETALKKGARHEEQVKRAVETRLRRKAVKESSK